MKRKSYKRDYLLPKGCKDLIDALNLHKFKTGQREHPHQTFSFDEVSPIRGELLIPAHATILQVAELLKQKPIRVVLDLMEMEIFKQITQELDFDAIVSLARKYGYIARKED